MVGQLSQWEGGSKDSKVKVKGQKKKDLYGQLISHLHMQLDPGPGLSHGKEKEEEEKAV